ncbi:MAG: hypothetical protein A2Y17_04805 [Clostridiales bacterium GWF2_38_85]|nr:MAG: hypothetical protein A2Y17_04805 [Clostridiales bacterium GWF2_38_85]HBL84392.1 phosphotransferase family protein [Clostridiales bacterium]
MKDIKNFDTFVKIEKISKGYSKDKKYYVQTNSGERLLLRLSDISNYAQKKSEYETMSHVASFGIPMPKPVDFGICDNGNNVYQLLTWCNGKDAEAVLPMMSETEQYTLGVQAGQILQKIHTIPAPDTNGEWSIVFESKINHRLREFEKCGICFEELAKLVQYFKDNRSLINNRQQSLIHNDYHNGNMMIDNNKLIIIDFNDCDYGDPWEEFVQAVWQAQYYPCFSTGQVRGYFDGEPPEEFWQVLAYYTISNYPTYISWAKIFGEDEVNKRIKQAQDFLNMCENMEPPVPNWYYNEWSC